MTTSLLFVAWLQPESSLIEVVSLGKGRITESLTSWDSARDLAKVGVDEFDSSAFWTWMLE